jgi:protein-disulfide isomerase
MRTLILGAAALALTASLAACTPKTETAQATSAPASVDRMPKEEVEAIVKDYLMKNPEVLVAAFEELDRRHGEAQFAKLVSHNNDPSIGPKDAAVTIVEFFDYNCGYCKAANEWVMKEAGDRNGKVRVVFKEFPILRESSEVAAKAALAANKQGKYREMHIALMKSKALAPMTPEGKEDLEGTRREIDRIAKSVGLNLDKLHKDMASDMASVHIDNVHREAAEAGIEATPGFFVNGQMLAGFSEKQLDDMIAKAKGAKKS